MLYQSDRSRLLSLPTTGLTTFYLMLHKIRTRKRTVLFTAAICIIALVSLDISYQHTSYVRHLFQNAPDNRPSLEAYIKSWKSLLDVIAAYPPNCPPPQRLGYASVSRFNATMETPLLDLLSMSDADVEATRQAHAGFVDTIKSQRLDLVYASDTRGIVTTAGGPYLPVVLISIRMLRRTGSILPVEVFLMAQSEFEESICNVVLPQLNARCLILTDIVDAIPHSIGIVGYQLKTFAILFSTFEEVLFLDADSFPLHDPDILMDAEPFRKSGMIMWPDFWYTTASEKYYIISSQARPATSLRATSEAGEILISKRTHQMTLMLAAYYNYYGPTHYYPLQSQGAAGEGDKETFLSAADVVGEAYYAVSEPVTELGHLNPLTEAVEGSAMVQYDPRDDYCLTQKGVQRVTDLHNSSSIKPFFIHANFPKFNPSTIFNDGGPTRDRNGTSIPAWTDRQATIESFGFDVERNFWEEIRWTACELEGVFHDWKGRVNICADVEQYRASVFGNG